MKFVARTLAVASVVSALACGPSKLPAADSRADAETSGSGSESSSTSTTDSTTDSTSITTVGTDTDTSDSDNTVPTLTDFVPRFDDGLWGADDCDGFAQDCPEGEKCVPYASTGGTWDATKCVPVTGSQATGEPCVYGGVVEAGDDCDEDSGCWNVIEVDGQWQGICHAFCQGTADMPQCPATSYCSLTGEGAINYCIPTCDPLAPDCSEGLICVWAGPEFICMLPGDMGEPGEPCTFGNDCLDGLCAVAESLPGCMDVGCCAPYCDLDLGDVPCDDALPGTSCVAFFQPGDAPEGLENVGVCVVP